MSIPKYCQLIGRYRIIPFKRSNRRRFENCFNGSIYILSDSEVFFETIYGWGIIVDTKTNTVIENSSHPYSGRQIIPISKSEYGDGSFKENE